MTNLNRNEEKAREFAENRGHDYQSMTEAFVATLDMAEWKDKQFAEENKWIKVEDKLPPFVATEFGIRRSNLSFVKRKAAGIAWQDASATKIILIIGRMIIIMKRRM